MSLVHRVIGPVIVSHRPMRFLADIDPLFVLTGFCVGILVGMTGVGGGSIMTPVLILLFGAHPAIAVGTDLTFAAATKAVGALVHGAARTIDWRLVGLLALGSIPATVATLLFLSMFDLGGPAAGGAITTLLAATLLVTSIFLLSAKRIRDRYADRIGNLDPRTTRLLTVLLGLAMGVLVTSTSVGAGAIGVTVLLLLHPKMRIARIIGSDIAHAVPLTLIAGVGHWLLGSVDRTLLGDLLLGSLPGVVIGSYLAGRVPDNVVRIGLALVLIVVAIKLAA